MTHKPIDASSPKIYLSVATVPFLLTTIAVRVIGEVLVEMGEASEEIFRGDRLPVLHLSETKTDK